MERTESKSEAQRRLVRLEALAHQFLPSEGAELLSSLVETEHKSDGVGLDVEFLFEAWLLTVAGTLAPTALPLDHYRRSFADDLEPLLDVEYVSVSPTCAQILLLDADERAAQDIGAAQRAHQTLLTALRGERVFGG